MRLAIAIVLMVVGFLTGFSIGAPFFILGLGMLVLQPFRFRRRAYWPLLLGLVAFLIGTAPAIPMWYTASGPAAGKYETVCSSLIGLTWSGSGTSNPPPARSASYRSARMMSTVVTALPPAISTRSGVPSPATS